MFFFHFDHVFFIVVAQTRESLIAPLQLGRYLTERNSREPMKQWRLTSTESGLFGFTGSGLAQNFRQLVYIIERTLSNTHFVASRHISREKTSPPFDVRRSKTLGQANTPRQFPPTQKSIKIARIHMKLKTLILFSVFAFRLNVALRYQKCR